MMMMSFKEKAMTIKKKPFVTAVVKPNRSVYEVEVPGAVNNLWPETFEFSIFPDGEVVVNDNHFNSNKVAATALRQMADFLDKFKAK
jgi:hypothetical protein